LHDYSQSSTISVSGKYLACMSFKYALYDGEAQACTVLIVVATSDTKVGLEDILQVLGGDTGAPVTDFNYDVAVYVWAPGGQVDRAVFRCIAYGIAQDIFEATL
jgi:hypothetical protein